MLGHGGAVEDAVSVGGPLDVAQPARPVREAHQVGVKRDGVVAGVTCEQRRVSFIVHLNLTGRRQRRRRHPKACLPDLG